jgi:hypothetical protein
VDLKTLQALCNDAVALRRGDQNAGWLALEREKFAEARKNGREKSLDACREEVGKWPDVQELFDAAFARLEERTKGTP